MGKKVYANGKEISAKASDCKVVAAMPDVCLSPPSPPAGPLPVPYPDSSFAKDLKDGSKDVKIGNQPVTLQDDSHYKSSPLGDEASTKSFGANVIDHSNAGKTHNAAFSMDVTVEGKKVPRTLDLTTSNHSSKQPSGGAMGPNIGDAAVGDAGDTAEEEKCECCGGPIHSPAQSRDSMTSNAFYSPSYPAPAPQPSKAVQKAIGNADTTISMAKEDGCGSLVHEDDDDPCAKHYPASAEDNKKARDEYKAMMSPLTPPEYFTTKYGEKLGKEIQARGQRMTEALKSGSKSIAHRTPLTAGGCPVGEGNLQPVSADCKMYEDALGQVQGDIGGYHRKVFGL
jgi:Domain of unknown function (DUF4150)